MISDEIGIDFFLDYFWSYWGNMLYLVLYLGILLYFFKYGSKLMKQIFVWPFIILLLTVYNPLIMGPVLELTGWADRYSRFFWVLPVEILCAYVFATLIERQKNVSNKAVVACLVICIVLMCGDVPIKKIPDENIYKMDNYIIEISELIGEAKTTEQPILVCDRNVYYQIRQYDASLLMAINDLEMSYYGEKQADEIDPSEQYLSGYHAQAMFVRGVEIDAELANLIFQALNVDFFVRNKNYYSDEYMQSLNLSYVGEVEGYEIYRCVHE